MTCSIHFSRPVSAASLPLPSGAAQDGTDGTGITAPSGAVGIRGWLSGIYNRLASPLTVNNQVAGTALSVNSGTKDSGTLRAVLATDQPALTNKLLVDPSGVTSPVSLAQLPSAASLADGLANPTTTTIANIAMLANGAGTYDKQRNNQQLTLLASVAKTASFTNTFTNNNGRLIILTWDVTAVSGSPTGFTMEIDYQDGASTKWVTLLQSASQTTTGTRTLTVGPGCPATANVSANSPLPRVLRANFILTGGSSPSVTLSIGYELVV